jgi:hypothetical protein
VEVLEADADPGPPEQALRRRARRLAAVLQDGEEGVDGAGGGAGEEAELPRRGIEAEGLEEVVEEPGLVAAEADGAGDGEGEGRRVPRGGGGAGVRGEERGDGGGGESSQGASRPSRRAAPAV